MSADPMITIADEFVAALADELVQEERDGHKRNDIYHVDILASIRTSQTQNGLRHNDYIRYRKYCTRRLGRIRKALKVPSTKAGKPHKSKFDPKTITDVRYLTLTLTNAEHAWAYAMEIKGANSEERDPRKRQHVLRRLSKAVRWGDELKKLCDVRGDERTKVEADAYASWMTGSNFQEREDWLAALQSFVGARTAYAKLAASAPVLAPAPGIPTRQMYIDRLEELEPNVRFCHYQLQRLDAEAASSIDLASLLDVSLLLKSPTVPAPVSSISAECAAAAAIADSSSSAPSSPTVPAIASRASAFLKSARAQSCLEEHVHNLNLNQSPREITIFPPNMEAASFKPVLFDIAGHHIEFPDLSAHIKPQKGFLGIFGKKP